MQASSRHHPTIFSMPTEVIEDVLVVLAKAKKPTSIAFLAQTCRYLRQIIYQPLDKYLWRRIFLSTFDDPRIYNDVYLLRNTEVFDWANEFRSRIWTASHIGSCIQALSKETSAYRLRSKQIPFQAPPLECDYFKRNLHSLLAVIDTSLPITHDSNISIIEDDVSVSNQINPPFLSLTDTDRASPPVPAASGQEYSSKNTAWLQSVISKGLPREFYPRFDNNVGDPYWIEPADGLLVHKLMAHIGFDSISVNGSTGVSPKRPRTRSNRCELVSEDGDWFEMSSEERFKRARFLARMKVFNVGYLSRQRAWGPFLPDLDGIYTDDDDESDPDDADFIPESENASNSGDEEEEGNLAHPAAHGPIPPPEDLYADWIHLAAIRMDVQACLQEHHQWEDIRESLTSLDGLRPGRWFPSRKHDNEQTSGSTYNIDWAGVEGVWRRCVCWLDYSDLYYYNCHGFKSPDIDEATLIVPLTLRITGYSPCTISGYERRPTIHVTGEMGGSQWGETGDTRRVSGTVGMIGDGSIRWSLCSSVQGSPNRDEWSSEGVQLGGVGSIAGILGLWTGANHEADDPLGAWWQWRVA